MHLLSAQRMARLKSNKRAYDHFLRFQATFTRYAQDVFILQTKYPELKNEETRVELVAAWIQAFDKSIWGLKSDAMSATELADSYARLVVGHESNQ
jgi:hypothetical protein